MELSSWLKDDKGNYKLLGIESFQTFLKVCSEFSEWALDDAGLANRSDSYKIWVCKVKSDNRTKVKEILERYSSMKLLLHYLNVEIIESSYIALYIKLDWKENKWFISYGITNNKKLFKVGQFIYNVTTKLPESNILKYLNEDLDDFNSREHLLLFKIKKDAQLFDPGYCQILDPQILNKEVIITTYNLGVWNDNGIEPGEAEKYLSVFKEWVKTQSWWSEIILTIYPRKNKWMDFKISLK